MSLKRQPTLRSLHTHQTRIPHTHHSPAHTTKVALKDKENTASTVAVSYTHLTLPTNREV